jgi:hypothetical protein
MHVAGQRHDRGRRRAACAPRYVRDEVGQLRKRAFEGRPVFEIDLAPKRFPQPGEDPAPGASCQSLAPGLRKVRGAREEERQRAREQKVVELAAAQVDDPGPLLVVHHLAAPVLE